jgi:hypothetical protein
VRCTGDQLAQLGQHLASVAYPETEGVGAVEEGGKGIAGARIEQNGLGPATAGAEHITVRESAAGGQAPKSGQIDSPCDHIR